MAFGRRGTCDVVENFSEETLDLRGAVSPRHSSDWGKEIHCFSEWGTE